MGGSGNVVIVGAGPVGLTLAADLTRYGVAVRIVDKAPHRSETSKALVVWSRSLELLDRIGCGEAFVAAGLKATGASIVAGPTPIGRVTLDHVASPHPYALMLPQSETERLLDNHLTGQGVTVERGVEATRLVSAVDGVTLDLRHADGSAETVTCDWLVGCDGAHSMVRHTLALPFAGSTLPSHWVLADVHLAGLALPPADLGLFWHDEGVLALFPISPGRYRIIADVGEDAPPEPSLESVQAIVDRRGPPGLRLSDPVWLSGFRINERKVKDYRVGRIFLAGDAAHVHSPAGGQGMNTGMQDAANLAWKLALVVRGEARAEPLMSSYSVERSAVGDMVLRNAGRLTALAVLSNPLLQSLRNHVAHALFGLDHVRETMANTLAEVAIRYEDGPLVERGASFGGPASGEGVTLQVGEPPLGARNAPRFTLYAARGSEVIALVERFPHLIDASLRPPLRAGGVWLVRPDGYVAVAAAIGDEAAIARYLDRLAAA